MILKNDDWIIEGVYYGWLSDSFAAADHIFILIAPSIVYKYRLIKRFIKRKLGLEKAKRETLKSFIELIRWTDGYQKNTIPAIHMLLEPYREKTKVFYKAKAVFEYLNSNNIENGGAL